jgi:hypothetical protein
MTIYLQQKGGRRACKLIIVLIQLVISFPSVLKKLARTLQ